MGCGCNKNKKNKKTEETKEQTVEFRQQEIEKPKNVITEKLTMMQTFASAITSRGLNNEKVTVPIKQLRVLGCFGNQPQGGVLPPCEYLKKSKTEGKFFCGGCGCGDRKGTWLLAEGEEYSKLDYPRLACPLKMPGFSNYEKSKPDEANPPITRKFFIEQMSYKDIEKIKVSSHEPPPPPDKTSDTAK